MNSTTNLYWTCDCAVVHKKSESTYCVVCDAEEKDSPDATFIEVENMLKAVLKDNNTNGDAFIQDAEQSLKGLMENCADPNL